MKRKLLKPVFLLGVFMGILLIHQNEVFLREEFMSVKVAEKKWGKQQFIPEKFKKSNEKARSEMVVSLIQSKKYIGESLKKISDELGPSDGYFSSDSIPAYILTPEYEKNSGIWQVVFIPDNTWKKVKDIRIHKNCCD